MAQKKKGSPARCGGLRLPFTPAHQDGPHGVDFIFDSNAVRQLASLSRPQWRTLEEAWVASKLVATWVPNVVGEVMGTNLWRRELKFKDLREVQTAVERYNTLARGEALPGDADMVRGNIFALAGLAPPDPLTPAPPWHAVVDFFLSKTRSPEQIRIHEDEVSLSVRFRQQHRDKGLEIVIPRGFSLYVRKKAAAMRSRHGYTGPVPRERQVEDLLADAPRWFADVGTQLSIPREVVETAFRNRAQFTSSAFAFRMITENLYYHHHATGYMSKRRDSDAQDIALSTYLTAAWGLVTGDKRLKALFIQVLEDDRRVLTLEEFVALVAPGLEMDRPLQGH